MPVSYSPIEFLSEVAGVAVTASLMSQQPGVAAVAAAGTLTSAFLNGLNYSGNKKTPEVKLRNLLRAATRKAMKSSKFEMPLECQIDVAEGLFSLPNATEYLVLKKPDEQLMAVLRGIVQRYPQCDVKTLPLSEIARSIVADVYAGIREDSDLLELDTNVNVNLSIKLLREILRRLPEKPAEQPKPDEPIGHWLTMESKTVVAEYINRPELGQVRKALAKHPKILLYGMGGVGKTELLRKLKTEIEGAYRYVAWIRYTDSLCSSLLRQMPKKLVLSEQSPEDALKYLERKLTDMAEDGLLILVDNIDRKMADDKDLALLQRLPCTVVVTARRPRLMVHFRGVKIELLSEANCRKLFIRYAKQKPPYDETALKEILRRTGCHTLVTEIVAKLAGIRGMPLAEVQQELEERGLDLSLAVGTAHSEDREERLMEQLDKLYTLASLGDAPVYPYILQNFAALPYLSLPTTEIIRFLRLDTMQEAAVYELAELGWLELSEDGLAMHDIVREIVRRWGGDIEYCSALIEGLVEVAPEGDVVKQRHYLPYLLSIAERYADSGENELYAKVCNKLGIAYLDLGQLKEALKWQLRAKVIDEQLYPDKLSPELAITYHNLAWIYRVLGKTAVALNWQLNARKIQEQLYSDGMHSDLMKTYNNLSVIYRIMGQLPIALDLRLRVKEICEQLYSNRLHPYLATAYNNLATIYRDMGQPAKALEWQLKDKETCERLYQDGLHPDIAVSYSNLSSIYRAMGQLPKALEWQLRAREIKEQLYPDGLHSSLAVTYNYLSRVYSDMGQLSKALTLQLQAKKINEQFYAEGVHPSLEATYGNLSVTYEAMGKLPQALKWGLRAKKMQEQLYSEGVHPNIVATYFHLADIYLAMGDKALAGQWQAKAEKVKEELHRRDRLYLGKH